MFRASDARVSRSPHMDEHASGRRQTHRASGLPFARWRRQVSPTGNTGDAIFRVLIFGVALSMVLIVGAMIIALAAHSMLSIREFGFGFLTGREWNPIKGKFGALAFVYGTLVSSLIALLISVPLSLGIAIFLVEQAPRYLSRPITYLVELLAAIPSVVYGLWGIFVLAPFLRAHLEPFLGKYFGWTGLFTGPKYGIGMLAAGIILAIMILPIIASITREVVTAGPRQQREAALALGATKWEMLNMAVLRNARPGVFGGIILGLGRALGETMAVTMV